MSGIFGKVGDGDPGKTLSLMAPLLRHRGTDDLGTFLARRIAIGSTLLRTRGPSEARQPIANADGTLVAALDGAILNGGALRVDLESEGVEFRANSDAELLLSLYERDGDDFVRQLRGHFAIAIWDARPEHGRPPRLFLARDHLGQKPLFYSESSDGFYFASEVKALRAVVPAITELNLQSLDRYLSMRFIPGDKTMLSGVKKLEPGSTLSLVEGEVTTSRYWRLSFAKKIQMRESEYLDALDAKFQETVGVHLAQGVETGAFLSGGLDSSLIVAMMARECQGPFPTFSIGFEEKEFDEIPYARIVAEKFGTRQIEGVADTDLIKTLPAMISGLDEPSDPVAASFYAASKLASKHVKIVLGGDGGNELFAGSDRYRGVLLARYYSMIPGFVRKPVSNALVRVTPASFGYDSLGLKLRWFEQMAGEKGLGEALANAVSFFRFNPAEKRKLFTDRIAANLDLYDAASEISDRYDESDAEEPIERMMYTDFCTRLPEHLLMLVDRMGMTHGVEIRSPLVDKELVEFMATLPLHMKVRGNKSRIIWRNLADRMLPESIAKRKKRGFRFPLAYWFAVKLHPFVRNVFEGSTLCADGVFNQQYMLDILEEHRRRRIDHSWRIWMLLNLEVWYRMYIRGISAEEVQQWIDEQANKG